MKAGMQYGLKPSDLWKATRRINLPEIISEKANDCIIHKYTYTDPGREIPGGMDNMDDNATQC